MVVMNDTIKGDTMNALEILTSKSKALANNIKTIETSGYTMKFVDEFKTFVDSQRSVLIIENDGSEIYHEITKYETQFIMEDKEGREVQVILSLVSKFDGRKIGKEIGMQGLIELAKAIKTSADMYLDDMKVKIDAVYYSKGMQGWERSSFAGLENELDELSYF